MYSMYLYRRGPPSRRNFTPGGGAVSVSLWSRKILAVDGQKANPNANLKKLAYKTPHSISHLPDFLCFGTAVPSSEV